MTDFIRSNGTWPTSNHFEQEQSLQASLLLGKVKINFDWEQFFFSWSFQCFDDALPNMELGSTLQQIHSCSHFLSLSLSALLGWRKAEYS